MSGDRSHAIHPYGYSHGTKVSFSSRHGERYQHSSPCLLTGLMSQTGQEFLNGNASYHFYIHRRLIEDETDSNPELCRELSQRTAPKHTFANMGKQHDTVRHIAFQLQRQGSAIDEGIPVSNMEPSYRTFFPVQRFISHQGRTAYRKEESLRRVGQELQIIAALGSKLGPWNEGPAIAVVLQQIFHASHPMVGPFSYIPTRPKPVYQSTGDFGFPAKPPLSSTPFIPGR